MTRALLLAAIRLYRGTLSRFSRGACRFEPSCSAYAEEAVRLHGAWRGAGLAIKRVASCHPLGPWGFDPVPPAGPRAQRASRRS